MKTTKSHFRIFEAECRRLHKLWRLDGWHLEVYHEDIDEESNADECASINQRSFKVRLGKKFPYDRFPPTVENLKKLARHEMIHGLLEPLSSLSYSRFTTADQLNSAEHEILQRLMGLLP